MSSLYYDETLAASDLSLGYEGQLVGDEAHHAISVSRVKPGENFLIGTGAGVIARVTVLSVGKKSLMFRVDDVSSAQPAQPKLSLIQSLAKGDRDERAIEACTELGVDRVFPYEAERSVSRWGAEKREKGVARWRKIAREASKQSLRHTIPEVQPPLTLSELSALASEETVLLLEPSAERALSALEVSKLPSHDCIHLLIGPEGGFSELEVTTLVDAGAFAVKLGDTVLRTSTAGMAALSLLNAKLGRW